MALASSSSKDSMLCIATECKRISRALCHCCSQNLCIIHLQQHDNVLNNQTNLLEDEINKLIYKLSQVHVPSLLRREYVKLEKWREEAIRIVNGYYEQTCQRLEEFVNETLNEQRKDIERLQVRVKNLIKSQTITKDDIDWISEDIDEIREKIIAQETSTSLVHIRPLKIERYLIEIDWQSRNVTSFDISTLTAPYLSEYFDEKYSYFGMAATENGRYLLLYNRNMFYLFDHLLNAKQRIKWDHAYVKHICYTSALNKFILLSSSEEKSGVFTLDICTMKIKKILDDNYDHGTCSNTHLYLSKYERAASTLDQYKLSNLELCRFDICTKDECISYMAHNSDMLALIIFKCEQKVQPRIEVRLIAKKLEKLWSIPMEFTGGSLAYNSITSLKVLGWLLIDTGDTCRRLIHISTDGNIRSTLNYEYSHGYPIHAALLGSDSLVVKTLHYCWSGEVKNRTAVNLHKLYLRQE